MCVGLARGAVFWVVGGLVDAAGYAEGETDDEGNDHNAEDDGGDAGVFCGDAFVAIV